ncbi:DNAJB12 (predicted), partial [Pycnogonum litorale]
TPTNMEGNKDESERCVEYAEKCINSGSREKAMKFLNKAEKLYPSNKARELIELLQKLNGATHCNRDGNKNANASDCRKRKKSEHSDNAEHKENRKEYSQDQVDAVKKVKRCKDYYEILGIGKDATDNDLKKQYRKLALQFHPDKNKAPGAAEAFKAIGNAFSVLSDSTKRKRYDMYGADEEVSRRSSRSQEYYDYSRGFEGDVTPEELFHMFFGGGGRVHMQRGSAPSSRHYHSRQSRSSTERQSGDHQESSGYGVLLQLMPLLILVFLSMMSNFFISDPPYSLSRSSKFIIPRTTSNLRISYFVKKDFEELYNGNLRRVEQEVEEEYIHNLRSSC